jgi:hypothetical protein
MNCGNAASLRQILHRQANALFVGIDCEDFDLDDVADFDHIEGVLDEFIGQLGDVDKAILMHTDVHERAKIDDVADGALQDHFGL